MVHVLLIDHDSSTLASFESILTPAGYAIVAAASGQEGLNLLAQRPFDLVFSELRLRDVSGLDILRTMRYRRRMIPFVVVTGFGNTQAAVAAMRLGATDFLDKPVESDSLIRAIEWALWGNDDESESLGTHCQETPAAHAAARWARALMPVLEAQKDPRTLSGWSDLAAASEGAIKNWCRTVGISPRRSLVFARLLRAVVASEGGRHKPENLLDVVDRRTLSGLLSLSGLAAESFPRTIEEFLHRQMLVRDPDALSEVSRAIGERRSQRWQHAKAVEHR